MKGILYGVGVGPGDPDLLTVKAVRLLEACDIVAVPDSGTSPQAALEIAGKYIEGKKVVSIYLPMTRDEKQLAQCRQAAAEELCGFLEQGKTVVFLTLGDPSVYSTYTYLHKLVREKGYEAQMVPGVTSFCAAAAALGVPLCESGQPLHILPSSYAGAEEDLALGGVKVLMKSGKKIKSALQRLKELDLLGCSMLAERVGMQGERLLHTVAEDEDAGYFSVIIVKE